MKKKESKIADFIKENKSLIAIVILSSVFLFLNLGSRYIANDESFTVLVGKTIINNGYPNAYYNGVLINPKNTSFVTIGSKSIYTWSTWLQEYITSFSMLIAGKNEFFLRFPFALFALASIVLSYFFIKDLTKKPAIASISILLMATSVSFCLHARQARWYGLVMFFGIATIYSYWLLLNNRKKSSVYFTISSIFLFYSNYLIFFGVILALIAYMLIFELKKSNFKKFIKPAAFIFLFTFPWFYLTNQFVKTTGATLNLGRLIFNLALNYYLVFIFLLPLLFLLFFLFLITKKQERKELLNKNYLFVFTIIIVSILFLSVKADTLPQIRYLIFMTPLFSLINATVFYKIYEKRKIIACILILLLIFSNLLNLVPFVFMKNLAFKFNSEKATSQEKEKFIENSLKTSFFLSDYIYEITHGYDSVDGEIIEYALKYGSKNDTFIMNSLGFRNTFMFYTDMKEAKINDSNIEWIIPRKNDARDILGDFINNIKNNINLSKYEEIEIDGNDERWADTPDLINHRFKTDKNGSIIIYHLIE